jgi:catechol 2,3-dioxygenase-like lactoylglutathione lyase family enzyme
MAVLADSNVAARIPAQDLRRARSFYADKLGLEPVEERPGGLRYRCGNGEFALFESAGAAAGDHTQMAWEVDDLQETIAELRERGVIFGDTTCPDSRRSTGLPRSKGTIPARAASGKRPPGSRTARAACLAAAGMPARQGGAGPGEHAGVAG